MLAARRDAARPRAGPAASPAPCGRMARSGPAASPAARRLPGRRRQEPRGTPRVEHRHDAILDADHGPPQATALRNAAAHFARRHARRGDGAAWPSPCYPPLPTDQRRAQAAIAVTGSGQTYGAVAVGAARSDNASTATAGELPAGLALAGGASSASSFLVDPPSSRRPT